MKVPPDSELAQLEGDFLLPKRNIFSRLGHIPNAGFAWLVVLPAIVGLAAFSIVPMATGLWKSLQEPGIGGGIGLLYYEEMINDPV